MAPVYISDFEVPTVQVLIHIFFLIVTWKLNMAHVYISGLEVPNLQVLLSLFHQKKQKGFTHLPYHFANLGGKSPSTDISISPKETKVLPIYCYHFANLEGHGARALFSPVSLPAT